MAIAPGSAFSLFSQSLTLRSNSSAPDASIDNKGVGYQVQVIETCNPENPVQIITA
jgi:hypothetical protein